MDARLSAIHYTQRSVFVQLVSVELNTRNGVQQAADTFSLVKQDFALSYLNLGKSCI